MKAAHILLALPSLGLAFPGMLAGQSRHEMLHLLKRDSGAPGQTQDDSQDLTDLVPSASSVVGIVDGLLGAVAASVDPENYRPEPGFEYQEPKPTDSRGPCSGLNLLANHGYLPRDGLVTFGQIVNATARGFNMGADLSTLLTVFTIIADGNIKDETFYLGTGPNNVGGLNRHDTNEADISPNREDFYLACGDNHHLSSRKFKQNVALAAQDPQKQFSLDVMGDHYAQSAAFSQKYNPYLYFFPFPAIVSLGATVFIPNFFSNGTYGAGGVANYESISSIVGAKLNRKTGDFEYVPERWPEQGWYRRATPYTALMALEDAFLRIYPKYPLPMGIPQLGTPNFSVKTVLCDLYNGINSIEPLVISPEIESVAEAITWALSKLADVGINGTVLGCPKSEFSPQLYPNSSLLHDNLNPPQRVYKNTGNNVYYKTYFTKAPTTPQCNHVSSNEGSPSKGKPNGGYSAGENSPKGYTLGGYSS